MSNDAMEQTKEQSLEQLDAIGKCLEPDGWTFVKDASDPAWWLGKFKHMSGVAVLAHAPNRDGKWRFSPTGWPASSITKSDYPPSRHGDNKWALADVGIAASKTPERIAKELKTRLLDSLLPVYQNQVQVMLLEEEKEITRKRIAEAIAAKLGVTLNYRPGESCIEVRGHAPGYVTAKVQYSGNVDISLSGLTREQVEKVLDLGGEGGGMSGDALTLTVDEGDIYEAAPDAWSFWVVVGNIAFWFRREGGGVIVSAFPNGEEDRPAMYELEVSHEEAAELGGMAYGEEG